MPEIVISDRRDPDFPTLLPFRWGEDWQVEEIELVYLNGEDGLLLKLMPLVEPSLPQLKLKFGHQYYYCPIVTDPVPLGIGSNFGELWIVSEINQCLLDIWGQGEIPCWRLTLAARRSPIPFLPKPIS
jgi:hypothetical protein